MSGLTVGYTSIDPLLLKMKQEYGTEEEKRQASRISSVINDRHLLLATLLLSNSLAMESLPIFLDAIMPATLAIIMSTTIVLIFGEVLPQAICIGPNQLKIASAMVPCIKGLICALWIVSYPIAKGLDYILGEHADKTILGKKDLKALIRLQKNEIKGSGKTNSTEGLNQEEIKIITSTIDLRDIIVEKIMIPISDVFKLNCNEILNEKLVKRITKHGFSRIPVFDNEGICIGVLWAKYLIDFSRFAEKTIKNSGIKIAPPLIISVNTNLLEALSIMEQRKISLALIHDNPDQLGRPSRPSAFTSRNEKIVQSGQKHKIVGLICLKDIFERLVEKEFEDHDLHLKSMLSMTYPTPREDQNHPKETGRKLIEMTEPEEYSTLKTRLVK